MRFLLMFFIVSTVSILSGASAPRARFELNSSVYKDGVRFVEFKTDKVDVAYKILSADSEKVVINVYFTNVSKKTITVDRSLFYVALSGSKDTFENLDPEDVSDSDPTDFFPRAVLKPDDSAGGQIVFSMKPADGKWVLKNKLTPHAFTFALQD